MAHHEFHILNRNHYLKLINSIKNDHTAINEYSSMNFTIQKSDLDDTTNRGQIPHFPDLILQNLHPNKNENIRLNELHNAKILYNSISVEQDFNWIMALNPTIWTYLCHTKYFRYIKQRMEMDSKEFNRMCENYKDLEESEKVTIENLIKKHFFTTDVGKDSLRKLIRNNISKLWLAPELTYKCWDRFKGLDELRDIANGNDYYMTEIVFQRQAFITQIFERPSISSHPELLNSILYFLSLDEKRKNTAFLGEFMKYITCNFVVNPIYINFNFDKALQYYEEIEKEIT
tara:strand:- start:280 stop:1143 length:864 start_codon:yes stop_codon:yes gene_type:complete